MSKKVPCNCDVCSEPIVAGMHHKIVVCENCFNKDEELQQIIEMLYAHQRKSMKIKHDSMKAKLPASDPLLTLTDAELESLLANPSDANINRIFDKEVTNQ